MEEECFSFIIDTSLQTQWHKNHVSVTTFCDILEQRQNIYVLYTNMDLKERVREKRKEEEEEGGKKKKRKRGKR